MGTKTTRPQTVPARLAVAEQLLEIVPPLMRLISVEAQSGSGASTLTATQLRALGLLKRGGRLPSELARDLGVSPATASEVVDLLVRRGLVQRGGRAEDRRMIPLCVTPEGSAQLQAARSRALAALGLLLDRLEATELTALERALEPLLDRLHRKPPASSGVNDGE